MINLLIIIIIVNIVLLKLKILKPKDYQDFFEFLKKEFKKMQEPKSEIANNNKNNYNSFKINTTKMTNIFTMFSKVTKWFIIIIVCLIIFLIANPLVTIQVGHRGVIFDKLRGGIQTETLKEGLHFKIPIIQNIIEIPVRSQKIAFVNTDNTNLSYDKSLLSVVGQKKLGSMYAASADLQDVYIDVILTYHLEPDKVAVIYQSVGGDYEDKKVVPQVIDSVKTYTAKYKVSDILTKREEIKEKVFEDLKASLAKDYIVLEDVNLVNFDFNKQFKDAIEQKQIEEQKAEKEKYILQQIEISSQQRVKKAEAEKQSKILEGEGIAEYNKLIQQEITDKVLEYKKLENARIAIEKWKGDYPSTYVGGGNDFIPLINLNK